MARVFITGSSDGLGRMAAQLLIEQGHRVVLHARNDRRGEEAGAAVPGAQTVVNGDLSSIAPTRSVADRTTLGMIIPPTAAVVLDWSNRQV
jgi:NAD(P)-dependent dehydrogenase (short-subunit alcohol dehydrogenase family)